MSKKQKFNYAIIGLIVAAIACVSTGFLGLIKGIVALELFTPQNQDGLNLALQISVALVVLGLASYAWIAPDQVRRFLAGRQARYGSNSFILILAFAGILVAVNFLAFNNPQSWDLTKDKENTLAPETIKTLQDLPDTITARAFYSSQMGASIDEARKLLENFKSNSKGKFEYEFVDPVANPVAAREAGVTGDGKIVLEMGGRSEIVSFASETSMLQAIARLINPEARTVYFLVGHGERDINKIGEAGMSRARETLENKNYTVKTLNLLAENRVPEDARAVIIAGPIQPLTPDEVGILNKYAQEGGALIVMEDPLPLTDFGDQDDPLAGSLERVWGIRLRNDFVVDNASTTPQNAIGANYDPSHPVTHNMLFVTIFPLARSLELASQPEGVTLTSLVETSPNSQAWGETDFTPLGSEGGRVELNPETDTAGPLTLVASAENTTTEGRVVVVGNSVFATDDAFDAYGNGDLFVNAVDWAVGEDNPVDITTTEPTQRVFNPPGQFQWLMILLGSIFLLPGAVIASGLAAWIARRRQG